MSYAEESRGSQMPTANTLRTEPAYPGKALDPKATTPSGDGVVAGGEAAGRPARFVGWDLGRNDHTDEVGRVRPAELSRKSLRHIRTRCTL